MKIVHVLPALTKGGAERVAVNLANAAALAGHDVTMVLAYPVDPAWMQDELDDSIRVRFLRSKSRRFAAYASLPRWIARNWGWLAGMDIVHCHLTFGSMFGEVLGRWRNLKRAARPKIVETYHAVGTPIPHLIRSLHRYLAARHDGFVVMASDPYWSAFTATQPQLHSAFIPNGIGQARRPTSAQVREYCRRAGIPAGAQVMGTVGRLVRARMPHELMNVFLKVAEMLPAVHFLMAGEGEGRAGLVERARAAGFADRFHFPGLVANPGEALANIDLYLSLNVGAITGIAALEAGAAGVPVIAFQANPSWRPDGDDWIFASSDPDVLAARAVELLGNQRERSVIARVQQQTVEQRFSSERMAKDYSEFYSGLLAEHSKPG